MMECPRCFKILVFEIDFFDPENHFTGMWYLKSSAEITVGDFIDKGENTAGKDGHSFIVYTNCCACDFSKLVYNSRLL